MSLAALTLSVCALALLGSCASQESLSRFAGDPEVGIEKMEISDITFDGIEVMFTLSVENPYPVGITLDRYEYDFLIEGNSFVAGEQEEGLSIAAHETSYVGLPLSFSFEELRSATASMKGKEEVPYSLRVGMDIETPVAGRPLKLSRTSEGKLPVPRVPRVSIKDVIITKFGLTEIFLEFGISVTNPNVFEVTLGSMDYSFSVNDRQWLSGETSESYLFAPEDTRTLYIPLELNYMQVGRVVVDMLMSDEELSYRIEGSSSVGAHTERLSIPEHPFSFDTSGSAAIIRP